MKKVEVVVVGAGAAGMAAAKGAAEEGAHVLLLENERWAGGILQQCIHNGFGIHRYGEELTGPEFAARLKKEIPQDVEVAVDTFVHKIIPNEKKLIAISKSGVEEIQFESMVFTTGARERTFQSLMIPGTRPAGIYTAGLAQKLINIEGYLPGKRALVLGSGDVGLIMARRMHLEGMEVVGVVERLPYPGGLRRNIKQCLEDFDIQLYLSRTVVRVEGYPRLEKVITAAVDENFNPIPGTEMEFKVDTLVVSVGLVPVKKLVAGFAETENGVLVSGAGQTSVDWLFAAGNVTTIFDLVDYVAKEGEKAGRSAALFAKGKFKGKKIPIIKGEGVKVLHPKWHDPCVPLSVYIRVEKPMEKAILRVGKYEIEVEDATPAEMINVDVEPPCEGEIVVSVTEV
jgi:NADPH-dependent 2,4-dienoyl-CoA reductase/sulfur reductase-like enzyme